MSQITDDYQKIANILQNTLMNDKKLKEEGEKQLTKIESEKGLVCFLNILTIKTISSDIKKIAAIRFKNAINNKWKKQQVDNIYTKTCN